jgi:hypothetical protein
MSPGRIVAMHARYITTARDLEASARRHWNTDPDRAAQAADDAAEARANAEALEQLIRKAGEDIHIPDRRQLSLMNDGETK